MEGQLIILFRPDSARQLVSFLSPVITEGVDSEGHYDIPVSYTHLGLNTLSRKPLRKFPKTSLFWEYLSTRGFGKRLLIMVESK